MDQTIIVTGGAGFIGCNFVRYALKNTEARIIVLDKLTYAGRKENLEDVPNPGRLVFIQGDIAVHNTVRDVVHKYEPTAIINFAAETHVDRSIDNPSPFIETNFLGTYQLLEVSRHYLQNGSDELNTSFRFIHISTDEVYGSLGEGGLFSEKTPYAPNSPYSASKAGADHLVRAYQKTYDLPTLITNCSNNYGPYQFPEKLIPLMILNALEGKPLPVYGDGKNIRDWLFVEDHCSGILMVLEKGHPGEKYNIGGHNEWTNIKVIETLCQILEKEMPSKKNKKLGGRSYKDLITFVPDRPGHDRRYAIDATKMKQELGWTPAHSFDKGLRKTVKWYLDHKKWCEMVQHGNYHRERLGLVQ